MQKSKAFKFVASKIRISLPGAKPSDALLCIFALVHKLCCSNYTSSAVRVGVRAWIYIPTRAASKISRHKSNSLFSRFSQRQKKINMLRNSLNRHLSLADLIGALSKKLKAIHCFRLICWRNINLSTFNYRMTPMTHDFLSKSVP
jgi:hypothetical protein